MFAEKHFFFFSSLRRQRRPCTQVESKSADQLISALGVVLFWCNENKTNNGRSEEKTFFPRSKVFRGQFESFPKIKDSFSRTVRELFGDSSEVFFLG
jgi:hypothetical protein